MGVSFGTGTTPYAGLSGATGVTPFPGVVSPDNANPLPLSFFIPSTVFDLDATAYNSYPGNGQTWFNLVPLPADGSTQSAYNFFLGASSSPSTDDPTFVGPPGNPIAYWSLDGGDLFRIASGSNTTFLNALHKTTGGTPFWMSAAIRPADEATSHAVMGTNTSSTSLGMRTNIDSGENIRLFQGDGTTAKGLGGSTALTIGNDYLCIFSYDGSTVRRWINTTTKAENTGVTLNTATSDAQTPFRIADALASGSRVYACAMGNAFIDDADAAKIFSIYEARHQRDYTP